STPWTGELRPERKGTVRQLDLGKSETNCQLKKGDLLGWFNMGSTVILLLPRQACELNDGLRQGSALRMGEKIGTLASPVQ
ncbi:MAG: phosphatidylserine decarboxylase, partial [Halioglobus sp.]|nr:phosphatidylserine decarboxylase [Halioglobus sp.]